MEPLVSINIPTYNSERTFDKCLSSVVNQTYRNIEIIIVDSYSHDKTLKIAKNYRVKIYFADILSEARRIGVEKSLGKYIFFLDSDQVLGPEVIRKCVEKCEKEGFDLVTLFERSIIEKNTFIEKAIAYDKWLFHSQHDDHPMYGAAIPRFFRRKVLRRITWPEGIAVQEHNIIYYRAAKVGGKAAFIDEYIYHHEPSSLSHYVRKFCRYGFYYIPALRENSGLVVSHSLPRRTYFSRKALKEPIFFPALFLLYIIKGAATFAGVISYLLARNGSTKQLASLRETMHSSSDTKSKELLHHYDDKYFEENVPKLDPYLKYILLNHVIPRKRTKAERIRVLDAGCGPGIYLDFFKENGLEAYGIDLSTSACRLTKQIRASATHLPFRNNCFDVLVLVHVIEHLSRIEVKNFLSEAQRVLKLSGKLFIMTPNTWSIGRLIFGSRWFEDPTHINLLTPSTLKKFLERKGFQSISFHHKTPPILPHKRSDDWLMPYYGLQIVWRKFPSLQDIIFFLMNSTPLSYLRDVIYLSAYNDVHKTYFTK